MQAQYAALPTHLSLGLKDIIMPIRWSVLSENNLFIIPDSVPVLCNEHTVESMKLPTA